MARLNINLTVIEIDEVTYPIGVVGVGSHPCEECALRDLCGHNGDMDHTIGAVMCGLTI